MDEGVSEYLEQMLRDRVGDRVRRGDGLASLGADRAVVVRRVRALPERSNMVRRSLVWAFRPRRVVLEIAIADGRIVEPELDAHEERVGGGASARRVGRPGVARGGSRPDGV